MALLSIQGAVERALGAELDVYVMALTLSVLGSAIIHRLRVAPSGNLESAVFPYLGLCLLSLLIAAGVSPLTYQSAGLIALTAGPLLGLATDWLQLKERERRVLACVLIFGLTINLTLALRQSFVGFSALETLALQVNRSTFDVQGAFRPLGALQSNQDFGLLAAGALPLLLAAALGSSGRLRALLFAVTALDGIALASSLLRSALLAGLVGALVAAWKVVPRRGPASLLVRLTVIVAAGIAVIGLTLLATTLGERGEAVSHRLTSLMNLELDTSYNARLTSTLPYALKTASEHPLGLGGGGAGPLSQAGDARAPLGPVIPDNGYLLVSLQVGVQGLLALLWMFRRIWTQAARREAWRCAGIQGALACLMTAMMLGGYWTLVGPVSCFFVSIALLFPSAKEELMS